MASDVTRRFAYISQFLISSRPRPPVSHEPSLWFTDLATRWCSRQPSFTKLRPKITRLCPTFYYLTDSLLFHFQPNLFYWTRPEFPKSNLFVFARHDHAQFCLGALREANYFHYCSYYDSKLGDALCGEAVSQHYLTSTGCRCISVTNFRESWPYNGFQMSPICRSPFAPLHRLSHTLTARTDDTI